MIALAPVCAEIDAAVAAGDDTARTLVKGVLELHAGALARVLELVGPELADRLAADDLVGAVLALHDLHPHAPARRIEAALRAHGDRLAHHGVIAESVVVDGDRARIAVVGPLAADGEAEIAAIALAAAPEIEAITVAASGAGLVPVEKLRRSVARRAP